MQRQKLEFYLNYVGCKVEESILFFINNKYGFTLTMWDVKALERNKRELLRIVLP